VRVKIATLSLLTAILLFSTGARADTVYTYTGNAMTEGANPDVCGGGPCSITGSFTLATPLGADVPFSYSNITPESFSFTDGNQTIGTGSYVLYFDLGTDASGDINAWVIQVYGLYSGTTTLLTSGAGDESYINGATVYNSTPGTWDPETVNANDSDAITPTPEPSSLFLLSIGLWALGFLALRRRQRQEVSI
jgi:hypothetical protein